MEGKVAQAGTRVPRSSLRVFTFSASFPLARRLCLPWSWLGDWACPV